MNISIAFPDDMKINTLEHYRVSYLTNRKNIFFRNLWLKTILNY